MPLPLLNDSLAGKIAKFSGIGVLNTLIHTALVVLSVERFGIHPSIANALAFVAANMFSYWANRRWNFKTRASIGQYGRFVLVSLAGLVITMLVSGLAEWAGWHYLVGLGLVFVALPAFTFVLHWRWTFRH
jgi:putative flippase GtrA